MQQARSGALDRLMRPGSVAVIGASDTPSRIGGRPIDYMLAQGFDGAIWPVNPQRATVQGLRAYPDVASLPGVPDVAIVAVPPAVALDAVEALGSRGCRSAIVFTAGFAEAGQAAAEAALAANAARHGLRLLGPNCLGAFHVSTRFYGTFTASFEKGWPIPGRLGIASQSGAYGTHIFSAAMDRRLGTAACITTGNEADLSLADAIAWMASADEIDTICAYAEGVRDGPSLMAALHAARERRKPVVFIKVGRSRIGRMAAQSHTASLAGDDAVFDAVLRDCGALRVRTTEEMLDVAYAAAPRIFPVRSTLGVVTISGGGGVLIADAAEAAGLALPEMPAHAQDELLRLIPFCAPRNPVDCTAQVTNDPSLIGTFLDRVAQDGDYPAILSFWSQVAAGRSIGPAILAQSAAARSRYPDRLWVASMLAPDQVAAYEGAGFLVFEDPSRAVQAIAALARLADAFARTKDAAPELPMPLSGLPTAANDLLRSVGIPVAAERIVQSPDEAVVAAEKLGFPVVLKVVSPDIAHKTEVGGVILDVADSAAVRQGWARLMANLEERASTARVTGVAVARQATGGLELVIGAFRDPSFGPMVMVGLGGVFVEVVGDVAFACCPITALRAESLIRSLRCASVLDGVRGALAWDISAAAGSLAALSALAASLGPALGSIEINPLLVMPRGQGCVAADVLVELQPVT